MTNKVLHGRPPRRLFRRLEPDGSLPFAKEGSRSRLKIREFTLCRWLASINDVDLVRGCISGEDAFDTCQLYVTGTCDRPWRREKGSEIARHGT